jgi:hypothetical protein
MLTSKKYLTLVCLSLLLLSCDDDEPTLPVVTTGEISDITSTSAFINGEVVTDGGKEVTDRGFVWSTDPNPQITGFNEQLGTGTGSIETEITELQPGTTYFVRAYAVNEIGIAFGEEKSFSTSITLPTLTTTSVTNITSSTATSGGEITFSGGSPITARGICWGLNPNPTTANNKTENGTGNGAFVSDLTNLLAGQEYFVRAYATNAAGTAYGNQFSFSTNSIVATLYAVKDAGIFNNANGTAVQANYGSGGSNQMHVGLFNSGVYGRSLVQFNLSSIPSNATITNVVLSFSDGGNGQTIPQIFVHKLTNNWTEGNANTACQFSGACNVSGIALTSQTDVTWNETSYSGGALTNLWSTAGGTFIATASATSTGAGNTSKSITSAGLVQDVQSWVSSANTNYGWLLKMDETITSTSTMQRYRTKEGAVAAADNTTAPKIVVTYKLNVN